MTKKVLAYLVLPVMALSVVGLSSVSAHGWFGGFSNATPEEIATRQQEMFDHKAELLGVSSDTVKEAWSEGKSLIEIAEENGVSEEELKNRMVETRKARHKEFLQALVDNGVISQAQANRRLQIMDERIGEGKMRGGFHRDYGFRF